MRAVSFNGTRGSENWRGKDRTIYAVIRGPACAYRYDEMHVREQVMNAIAPVSRVHMLRVFLEGIIAPRWNR